MNTMLTNLLTAVTNALVTESQMKVSYWGKQDYGTCYQGSDLSPQKVAAVLKDPKLAKQSSDAVKQVIAEKVKAYDDANGFVQLIWRWSQPIDAYQRFYTINCLYGLEAQLSKAAAEIKVAEKKGDRKDLRKVLLPILFAYQTSYIPNYLKAGFFDGHRIYILNQQMNKIFIYLKQAYEDHYHILMMDALLCKEEEIARHENKIAAFFAEIETERAALAVQYQQSTLAFFSDAKERKALLTEILRLRKEKTAVASASKKEKVIISQVEKRWQHRLADVNDHLNKDCRIQIGRGERILPNTYVLEKRWWGSWRLYYYGNKYSKSQSIAIETILGLKEALQQNNKKEVAKILSEWHQEHGALQYTLNPAQKYQAINRLSSRNAAREMIGKHPLLSHVQLSKPSFQQSLTDYAKRLIAFGKELVGWRASYDVQYQPVLRKVAEDKKNWDQALRDLREVHQQLQIEAAKDLFAKQEVDMKKRWEEKIKGLASINVLSTLAKRQFAQEAEKEHAVFQQWLEKHKDLNAPQGYSPSSHIKEIQAVFNAIEVTDVMKATDPQAALRIIAENKAGELLVKYTKEETDIEKLQSIYQEISGEIERCLTRLDNQNQHHGALIPSPNAAAVATASPSVTTTTTTILPHITHELTAMPGSDEPDVWENWLRELKQKAPRAALGKSFHTAFTNLVQHNQAMKGSLRASIKTMLAEVDTQEKAVQNKAEYEKNKAIAFMRFNYLLKLSICLIELIKHGYFKEEKEQIHEEISKSLKETYNKYILVLHPDKSENKLEKSGFEEIYALYQTGLDGLEEAVNASYRPAWLNSTSPSPNITISEETVVNILKETHERFMEEMKNNLEAFIKEQRETTDVHIKKLGEITDASLRRMDESLEVFLQEERAKKDAHIKEQREATNAHIKEQREATNAHIKEQREATNASLRRMDESLEVFFQEERAKKDAHIKEQREATNAHIKEQREITDAHINKLGERTDAHIKEQREATDASLRRMDERQKAFIEEENKAMEAIAAKHKEFDRMLEEEKQAIQLLNASFDEQEKKLQETKERNETLIAQLDKEHEIFLEQERKEHEDFSAKNDVILSEIYAEIELFKTEQKDSTQVTDRQDETIIVDSIIDANAVETERNLQTSPFLMFAQTNTSPDHVDLSNEASPQSSSSISEPIVTTSNDLQTTDAESIEALGQSPSSALFQHVHRAEYAPKPEPSTTPKKPGLSGSYGEANNG